MGMEIITGHRGTDHVGSDEIGAQNAGMVGLGRYVFDLGEKFDYEIISNNLVRIKNGYGINQGRVFGIKPQDYEELIIDNGLVGVSRYDLISARYEKNAETGIENISLVVIKGTSSENPVYPTVNNGDILNGAIIDDFPLWAIKITGLSIVSITQLFSFSSPSTIFYSGKKVVAFGDSITWGQSSSGGQSPNNWVNVFGNISGAVATNSGIGGTSMAIGESIHGFPSGYDAYAFCNRVDNEDLSSYDVAIIMYGTNDYGYAINMGNDSDASKYTFKGALNYSLDKISKTYPNLKVIIATPIYAPTSLVKNVKGLCMIDYVNAIKTISRKYNYQVIDLHNGMGINIDNYTSYYWDSLHPNDATYDSIAKYIYTNMFSNYSYNVEYTSGNLLTYNTFNSIGGGYFTDFEELGDTLSLASGTYKESQHGFSLLPNTTYAIDFCCSCDLKNQYLEFDFFDSGALCFSGHRTNSGENRIQLKITTPNAVDRNVQYKFRIASSSDNTTTIKVTQLSLRAISTSPVWCPPEGTKRNKKWSRATIVSPNIGETEVLYYKDAEGFVHLWGKVSVLTGGTFITIPTNCSPQYQMMRDATMSDGTRTYVVINTNGNINIAVTGVVDLSSIDAFFGDDVNISVFPQ